MIGQEYTCSRYDHCVYFRQFSDGSIDMLIASKDKSSINRLKSQLSREFEIKDLGAGKKILDMEILRD